MSFKNPALLTRGTSLRLPAQFSKFSQPLGRRVLSQNILKNA